MFEESYVEEN